MVRAVVFALALVAGVFASQIEISSNSFYANENERIGEFTGNVRVRRGSDELMADKAVVYFNASRQPLKYIASGNASFRANIKGKRYSGSGNELIYDAKAGTYTIVGKAHIREIDSDKNVYGERIVIDQKSGTYSVGSGENKPVRFIFNVKDTQN